MMSYFYTIYKVHNYLWLDSTPKRGEMSLLLFSFYLVLCTDFHIRMWRYPYSQKFLKWSNQQNWSIINIVREANLNFFFSFFMSRTLGKSNRKIRNTIPSGFVGLIKFRVKWSSVWILNANIRHSTRITCQLQLGKVKIFTVLIHGEDLLAKSY